MLKHYQLFFNISENPKELKTEECIWCGSKAKKNTAHIISKSLLKTDHYANKLSESVCQNCNTFFGKYIEDWIFKYSPISFWINRDIRKTMELNDDRTSKYKQIFIWFNEINEWFVALNEDSNQLHSQLICNEKYEFTFFYHSKNKSPNQKENQQLLLELIGNIKAGTYTYYTSDILPKNFSPRIFRYYDKVIVVSKNKDSVDFCLNILKVAEDLSSIKFKNFYSGQKEHKHLIINYKWSFRKHYKYCSKIAFEFLSLIQGSNFVKEKEFNSFKNFILEKEKTEFSNVLFINGKGINLKKLSLSGWVDVSNEALIQKKTIFPTFYLDELKNFTFSAIIYKFKSHICASIKLFEFAPCNVILSSTTQEFETIHLITYSAKDNKLLFYKTTTDLQNFDQAVTFISNEKSLHQLGK